MRILLPEEVSLYIWRKGHLEPDTCAFLLEHLNLGMTFVDIGSHFGFFTLLGSSLVGESGHVLAFEPMPRTFRILSENIGMRAAYRNIVAFNVGVGAFEGEAEFNDFGPVFSAFNSVFPARILGGGRHAEKIRCRVRSIDSVIDELQLTRCDVIKIDAESSEFLVIAGMARTIERFRPNIILEVGDYDLPGVSTSRKLIDTMIGYGYAAWECRNGQWREHERLDRYSFRNLFFVHGDRWQSTAGALSDQDRPSTGG